MINKDFFKKNKFIGDDKYYSGIYLYLGNIKYLTITCKNCGRNFKPFYVGKKSYNQKIGQYGDLTQWKGFCIKCDNSVFFQTGELSNE